MVPFPIANRDREEERSSFPWPGFDPYLSTVALDNLLYNSKTDARSGILFSAVEALEHQEYLFRVRHFQSNPVVLNGEGPFLLS